MPTAVISDVHGNGPALDAVLKDIHDRGIDRIVCLGDIIGYGPDPLDCVDTIREKCQWALMGNHDFSVLYEPTNFNPSAEQAAFWTRTQFDAEQDPDLRKQRYQFLGSLKVRHVEHAPDAPERTVLFVHGSPRRPINEYIFPDDVVTAPDKLSVIFERVRNIAMVGHTHQPGVFTDEPDFYPPNELTDNAYTFSDERAIINVGSVGQPRDLDPRACYVVLHPDKAQFVRVEYDVQATAGKIRSIAELDDYLGERILIGR